MSMTLTKAELADMLFEQVGLNKREAKDMVECFFEDEKGPLRFFTRDGSLFLKLSAAPDLGMFRRYMYRREMAGFIRDEILEQHNFGRLQVRTSFFHDMDIEISGI